MTAATRDDRRSGVRVVLATASPWLVYIATLAGLSLVERSAFPESVAADGRLDSVLNWVALVGLVVAAGLSVAAMPRGQGTTPRGGHLACVLAASFIGPLLGTVVVTALAQDVDGGGWMLLSPVLGLGCAGFLLFARAGVEAWRRRGAV
jgi:hypothetical protein